MKFPMTRKGCEDATKWMKENDYYGKFLSNTFSTDGYSLIATANYFYEKANELQVLGNDDPARVQ